MPRSIERRMRAATPYAAEAAATDARMIAIRSVDTPPQRYRDFPGLTPPDASYCAPMSRAATSVLRFRSSAH